MRGIAGLAMVLACALGGGCSKGGEPPKEQAQAAGAGVAAGPAPPAALTGPCAPERDRAAKAWDGAARELETMRDAILKEAVHLETYRLNDRHQRVKGSEACRYVIDLPEYNVAKNERAAWDDCKGKLAAIQTERESFQKMLHDPAAQKERVLAAAAAARELAERYRTGPVPPADGTQMLDRVTVYYNAAWRVQSTGPHCIANDCLTQSPESLIKYDMKPISDATERAATACGGGAAAPAAPAAPPAAAPEPECTPKVVFDQTPGETGANLRADPDGEVLLEIPNCTEVCVYEIRDGWARVSASPRDVGFIHDSRLLPTDTARCNP